MKFTSYFKDRKSIILTLIFAIIFFNFIYTNEVFSAGTHVQTIRTLDNDGDNRLNATINTGSGNLLIATVTLWSQTNTPPSVLSIKLDGVIDFTIDKTQVLTANNEAIVVVASLPNVSLGAHTVTVNTASNISVGSSLYISEFSGMQSSNVLDGTASQTSYGSNPTTGIIPASQNNNLFYSALFNNVGPIMEANGAWVIPSNGMSTSSGFGYPMGSVQYQFANNPISGSWNVNNSNWVAVGASYKVGNMGTTTTATSTPTTQINIPSDVTSPVISNVSVTNITTSSVTINWTTNELVTTFVQYGQTTSYGQTSNSNGSLSHSITLSGLASNTIYNFRISATDFSNNNSLSNNQSFRTNSIPSVSSASSGLLSEDRVTLWNPGMMSSGGIPNRTTICATINASSFGNGLQESSTAINQAIANCPVGQVVQLSEGTFLTNNAVSINKSGVTLRGAGPDRTILSKTNGAVFGSYQPVEYESNVLVAPNPYPHANNSGSVNLTSDAVDGTYSVTVSNASGFRVGQFVIVDEDQYNTGTWQRLYSNNVAKNSEVWVGDRILWKKHRPTSLYIDDPFPDALSWFNRGNGNVLGEIKEIASISGNTITFTTPFHITYRSSLNGQVTPFNDPFVVNSGVENLTMQGGSVSCLSFYNAAKSWAKNVECTNWLGHGIDLHQAFKVEVRDSTVHDGAWQVNGGGGYAIDIGVYSSEILIENNVMTKTNKVIVANSGGAGSVVSYNYTDDSHIEGQNEWQEVGINGSHFAGSHHILFEGNYSPNGDNDSTHGGAIYHTFFRNHLSGFRKSYSGMANARTAGAIAGSWWMSFIGNVLGTQGRMSGWIFENNSTPWVSAPSIWKLGYEPTAWDEDSDPKVLATIVRGGNFDYLTNSVTWQNINQQNLPNSLYLSSKPNFFGSYTWPWVDPLGSTKLYTLPAKYCYEQGRMPDCLMSSNGVVINPPTTGIGATTTSTTTTPVSNSTTTPPINPPTSTTTPEISNIIKVGDRVEVTTKVNVRSVPGGKRLGTQLRGSQGVVIEGPRTLNGYTWYKINFSSGVDGWVVSNYLTKLSITKMSIEELKNSIASLYLLLQQLQEQLIKMKKN